MEYSSNTTANKILIVDDEQPILETFIEMFELKGFNCDGAENGLEALHLTEQNNYDIIVSDINMPVMSGTAFFTKLQETNDHTPFIFITGYEVTSEIDKVVKKATAIISKPVQFQEFMNLIEKIRFSIN
jgi:DNA-binding NtrC family response regulator